MNENRLRHHLYAFAFFFGFPYKEKRGSAGENGYFFLRKRASEPRLHKTPGLAY